MKYLAAYLLAQLGGVAAPSSKNVEDILGSVGIDVDGDALKAVLKSLEGKNVEEVISEGSKKLASVPSGGAAPAAAAASSGSAAAPAPAASKKEEKKEESEDEDMGFGLFD
ncbi:60S acidic ribosomal protein P2 [Strongyloides ratti]|uniref:Large ribosomal subunit protein P2 n=1 Tax=Strongyloides ratti TaxID=34506 RepID=A0A090LFB6_STRRB|nr:60S acidic ribosomal protein P2 [Strongyloides ratti]CEF68486.1 60S acidic ribosomal protein P2 [Strongyloides ratti]